MFFFRKPKVVDCVICGEPIAPTESRYADKNRITKAERHRHLACGERDGQYVAVPRGVSPVVSVASASAHDDAGTS
jgi:hypothetical protein